METSAWNTLKANVCVLLCLYLQKKIMYTLATNYLFELQTTFWHPLADLEIFSLVRDRVITRLLSQNEFSSVKNLSGKLRIHKNSEEEDDKRRKN